MNYGHACFSPDGQYVVSGAQDGAIFIWRTQTGHLQALLEGQHKSAFLFLCLIVIITHHSRRISPINITYSLQGIGGLRQLEPEWHTARLLRQRWPNRPLGAVVNDIIPCDAQCDLSVIYRSCCVNIASEIPFSVKLFTARYQCIYVTHLMGIYTHENKMNG
jgi:hypothetical protein